MKMTTIQELIIDNDKKITISIPSNIEDKYNYYFKPSIDLHICDQVYVYFFQHNTKTEISCEMFDITYEGIFSCFSLALTKNTHLPPGIEIGMLAYTDMVEIIEEKENFCDLSPYAFCSSSEHYITFLYRHYDTIYLEISEKYPWLYTDPKPGEKYIPFTEYIHNYKPLLLQEIPEETVAYWLTECHEAYAKARRDYINV